MPSGPWPWTARCMHFSKSNTKSWLSGIPNHPLNKDLLTLVSPSPERCSTLRRRGCLVACTHAVGPVALDSSLHALLQIKYEILAFRYPKPSLEQGPPDSGLTQPRTLQHTKA